MEIASFAKVLSVAAAFLANLVPSVQPFHPPQGWTAVPGLAGRYSPMRVAGETGAPEETFVFSKNAWEDPPSYTLKVRMDGRTSEFEAAPFRLEGMDAKVFFLDLQPKLEVKGNNLFRAHALRAHSVAKVEVVKDGLGFAFLDKSALKKRRDAGEVPFLMDSDPYGGLLLTAPTAELHAFLKSAVAAGLFVEHGLYRR